MDTLIIQGKYKKLTTLSKLSSITRKTQLNRNINWEILKNDNPALTDQTNCLIVPVLIHQHHKGKIVFPHLRCHIIINGIDHILINDLSIEEWVNISKL
jgi:hypothetical protein